MMHAKDQEAANVDKINTIRHLLSVRAVQLHLSSLNLLTYLMLMVSMPQFI